MTFLYCLRGQASIEVTVCGKSVLSESVAEESTLFFCLNGTLSISSSRGKQLQVAGLQVPPDCLRLCACTAGQQHGARNSTFSSVIRGRIPLHLHILLEQIMTCQTGAPLRDVFLTHKKYELFYQQLELLGRKRRHKPATHAEQKAACQAYGSLLQDISKSPSLSELAASVGVNRMRLTELFRMLFGDTVFGILRRKRLECARNLLGEHDRSITEIAYLCGFSSPSHLTRAFSAQFGINPKRYQLTCSHASPTSEICSCESIPHDPCRPAAPPRALPEASLTGGAA